MEWPSVVYIAVASIADEVITIIETKQSFTHVTNTYSRVVDCLLNKTSYNEF